MKLKSSSEIEYMLVSILLLPLQISLTGFTTQYCVLAGPRVKHLLILAPLGQEAAAATAWSRAGGGAAALPWKQRQKSSRLGAAALGPALSGGCAGPGGVLQQLDTSDAVRPTLLASNHSLLYSLL